MLTKGEHTIPYGQPFLKTIILALFKETHHDPLSIAHYDCIFPTKRPSQKFQHLFAQESPYQAWFLPRIYSLPDLIEDPFKPHFVPFQEIPSTISYTERMSLALHCINKFTNLTRLSLYQRMSLARSLLKIMDDIYDSGQTFEDISCILQDQALETNYYQQTKSFISLILSYWPKILEEKHLIDPKQRQQLIFKAWLKAWQNYPPYNPLLFIGFKRDQPALEKLYEAADLLPHGVFIYYGKKSSSFFSTLSYFKHKDIELVETLTAFEEARVVSLKTKQSLEKEGSSIVLVTPSFDFASLIQNELKRFGIYPNSVFGMPLMQSVVGSFMLLTSQLFFKPSRFDWLAVLKHPLCYKNKRRYDFLHKLREFEQEKVRGNFIFPPFEELLSVPSLNPFLSFKDILNFHEKLMFKLAGRSLWSRNDGEVACRFFEELKEKTSFFSSITLQEYPSFLKQLMVFQKIPTLYGIESRVSIIHPNDLYFEQADTIIICNLNDEEWPSSQSTDSWFSINLRLKMGLKTNQDTLQQCFEDFLTCFGSSSLFFTRSINDKGKPTVPSKLWNYLNIAFADKKNKHPWLTWTDYLLTLTPSKKTFQRPQSSPPVVLRPKKLSVTAIETLRKDPYAIYAKYILNLSELSGIDPQLSTLDKGKLFHHILNQFVKSGFHPSHPQAVIHLQEIAKNFFESLDTDPVTCYFWLKRFSILTEWIITTWQQTNSIHCQSEYSLETMLTETFTLTSRLDRLDFLDDGSVGIVDYKTGKLPTQKALQQGYACQLALEGLIVSEHYLNISYLQYWQLKENNPQVMNIPLSEVFLKQTKEGLLKLIKHYQDPATAYIALPNSKYKFLSQEYNHLERVDEWI